MELPVDGDELRAAAGHSSHGSAPEELILPPCNIASQMQIISGNPALGYGDANQLDFSLDYFAHTMPDNIPSTWFPLSEPNHPLDYFGQQHFGGAISNAGSTVAFPEENDTSFLYLSPNQNLIDPWLAVLEASTPNTAVTDPSGHSNDSIDVVPADRCTSFQSGYTITHTSGSPVQSQYFATNSNSKRRKKRKRTDVKKIACATCWGMEKGCKGEQYCDRCYSRGLPGVMCIRVRMIALVTFDKYLIQEWKSQIVYEPSGHTLDPVIALLRHDPNGSSLPVKCQQFTPDPELPHQTLIFWKGPNGYEEVETTAWSVHLDDLEYDLEPYVETSVPIYVTNACNGSKETAELFRLARQLIDKPIICLCLKMYTALKMLMRGWSMYKTGDEILGMPVLHAKGAPTDGETTVPATMQRQLDHRLEILLAKLESQFCDQWQKVAKTKGYLCWSELFLSSFVVLHVKEMDALRLKIRFEDRATMMNGWKHPDSPTTLVEKTIHFCNGFLAHFRAVQRCDPLRLGTLEEDSMNFAKGDFEMHKVMQALREHKAYLHANVLINRKPWEKYMPGADDSFDFTWSSMLFLSDGFIQMEDFLGPGVPGWT